MRITRKQLRRIIKEVASQSDNKVAFDIVDAPDNQTYQVSTINRASSALASHGATYAETMVFDISDPSTRRLVWQDESIAGSRVVHDEIVDALKRGGRQALIDRDIDADDDYDY